jgi:hypothetical protein
MSRVAAEHRPHAGQDEDASPTERAERQPAQEVGLDAPRREDGVRPAPPERRGLRHGADGVDDAVPAAHEGQAMAGEARHQLVHHLVDDRLHRPKVHLVPLLLEVIHEVTVVPESALEGGDEKVRLECLGWLHQPSSGRAAISSVCGPTSGAYRPAP